MGASVVGLFIILGANLGDGYRKLEGDSELFFSQDMHSHEVDQVAEFIERELIIHPGRTISFRVDRDHGRPRFGMVILPGRHMDPDTVAGCEEIAQMISDQVFDGDPVDFVMYDEWLNETRVLEPVPPEIDPLTYDPFQIDYDSLPRVEFSD